MPLLSNEVRDSMEDLPQWAFISTNAEVDESMLPFSQTSDAPPGS